MNRDHSPDDHKPAAEAQDAILKYLTRYTLKRSYEIDQHIVNEGDICEAACYILEGKVRVYKLSPQGRQRILIQPGPGQAFNTVTIYLNNGTNGASAVAVTPVTLLVLFKDQISEVLKLCPELALVIIHDFAERFSHLSSLACDLALQPVKVRLARFLLDQVNNTDSSRWTHEEIAAHIGSERKVASRTMRDSIKQGFIQKYRHHLVIIDTPALEREAEGEILALADLYRIGSSDKFL